eukprot:evm.model.scf_151.13 EVM.evm.TU.scf_151.13   scf_151:96455-100439(-)
MPEIEAALSELWAKKDEWANVSAGERAKLLEACLTHVVDVARETSKVGTQAHGSYGLGPNGEEMLYWSSTVLGMSTLLRAMRANGQPKPMTLQQRPNGQFVAEVFPQGVNGLIMGGMKGEVWIQKGKPPTQGRIYRDKDAQNGKLTGQVGLVLGAGNVVSTTVIDILHMLLVEDHVVIVKMNPVNAFYGPFVEKAVAPFHCRGFVKIVYGGADVGCHLCHSPMVTTVHLTGSERTFNAIVWGGQPKPGDGKKPLNKVIRGELGCVTPCIIFPGNWTDRELEEQAKGVATGLVMNSSHNCCAHEVIVTSRDWPQRGAFLSHLRAVLSKAQRRVPWYPGSKRNYQLFFKQFPDAEKLGTGAAGEDDATEPWGFMSGLSPDEAQTRRENWCGVLQEVCLPGCGNDVDKFSREAVAFANNKCWGTLSCSLIVHPATKRAFPRAVEHALEELKYGTIVVNGPAPVGFAIMPLTWGAYPGNTLEDIGSGNCLVHNTYLYDHPEKSVLHVPWNFYPPFWLHTFSNLGQVMEPVLSFVARPTIYSLMRIILPACRSQK